MASDVCLILEATYPYVAGGVSSWVHQLIRSLPDVRFSIVHIGSTDTANREMKYTIPSNVVELREVYLRPGLKKPKGIPPRMSPEKWALLGRFIEGMRHEDYSLFARVATEVLLPGKVDMQGMFFGTDAWDFVTGEYTTQRRNPSFIDYFWIWRFMHMPIVRVMAAQIPRARCYHALSTGYAGLMGAAARVRSGAPFVLTEHGIYNKERQIEISQADWIFQSEDKELDFERKERYFKDWWMKMFLSLSRISYIHADSILTLFEGNRLLQVRDGADPRKIEVVPNGIDVEGFASLIREGAPEKPVIALIGRVVPIKDIKTFIRAAKHVRERRPDVTFRVIGPTDEDPEYFQDCLALAAVMGLSEAMTFTGKADVKAHLPEITCQALSSISEGQPLVVLEGMAAGVPFVSTDVGSCRELAEGRSTEDSALGRAGYVVPIGNHEALAEALLSVVESPELRTRLVEAGRLRVGHYYRQTQVSARYQQIYEELPYLAALRRSGGGA